MRVQLLKTIFKNYKMAGRFFETNDFIQDELKGKAINENTKKSTKTWLRVWQEWAVVRNYSSEIESYSPEDLDEVLQKFYAELRNKKGEDYEPDSLKVMQAALDRHLRDKNYPRSIIRDREFDQCNKILEGKARQLRELGRGKRPNAAKPLTLQEEEMLWENEKLGNGSPRALINTMWWLLTQQFGLRGRQEHHTMAVEDFGFGEDDNGVEYVTFKENPTKTRQGGLHITRRPQLPKMFATGDERCPVSLFKEYLSRRPSELRASGPFYLTPLPNVTPNNSVWFKRQNLGVNSIDKIMKMMIADTPLEGSSKRLTNHSARKTLVKKLRANNVERSSIINVTGHRNEQSLNDYDEGNENEQRQISNLISNAKAANKTTSPTTTSTTVTTHSQQQISFPSSSFERSFERSFQRSFEQSFERRCLPTNQFHNCNVVFNVGQSGSSSPKVKKYSYSQ